MWLEGAWGQEGTQHGCQQLSQEAVVTAEATGMVPPAGVVEVGMARTRGHIPDVFCRWSQQDLGMGFVSGVRETGLRDDS